MPVLCSWRLIRHAKQAAMAFATIAVALAMHAIGHPSQAASASGTPPSQVLEPNARVEVSDIDTLSSHGRLKDAESKSLELLAQLNASETSTLSAKLEAIGILAKIYALQKRFDEAESTYLLAIALSRSLSGDDTKDTWYTVMQYARFLGRRRRYDEATLALRQQRDLELKFKKPAAYIHAADLGIAEMLIASGRDREAEELLARLVITIDQEPSKDGLREFFPEVAELYLKSARFTEAESLLRRALALSWSINDPGEIALRAKLARALRGESRFGAAVDEVCRVTAIRDYELLKPINSDSGFRHDYLGRLRTLKRAKLTSVIPLFLKSTYQECASSALQLYREGKFSSEVHLNLAFDNLQYLFATTASRSIALAAARQRGRQLGIEDKVNEKQRLTALVLEQETLTSDERGAWRAEHIGDFDPLGRLTFFDGEVDKVFDYDAFIAPPALKISQVQSRLSDGQALLAIYPSGENYVTFVVTKISATARISKSSIENIDRLTGRLKASLSDTFGLTPFDRKASFQLYIDLIAPVEPVLTSGGVKRLLIVAAGSFSDIPLAVLRTAEHSAPTGSDNDWLADRYSTVVLPSVNSFGFAYAAEVLGNTPLKQSRREEMSFVGYGNPALSGHHGPGRGPDGELQEFGSAIGKKEAGKSLVDPDWVRTHFAPLPGTARELPLLAAALGATPEATLRLLGENTEARAKQDPLVAGARVVVFATHGFLPGQVPGITEPGLVFTPPARASSLDDGVLSASEVAELRMKADWVILSACNTATPDENSASESLSSLARGFLYSGAKAVLASHWEVNDAAAVALTSEALRAYRRGLTRGESLQIGMRAVRTGRQADNSIVEGWRPEWSEPGYWAPFTVISNDDK